MRVEKLLSLPAIPGILAVIFEDATLIAFGLSFGGLALAKGLLCIIGRLVFHQFRHLNQS